MDPKAKLAAELVHLTERDEYLVAASELLLKLIPADHAAWNEVDPAAGQSDVRAFPEHSGIDIPKMLLELYAEHPIVVSFQREPSEPFRRLSDLVSDRQLYRTRAFREGLSRLEVNRQLVAMTSIPHGNLFSCWTMNRWGRDFSDGEVELARHVHPMLRLLEQAYGGRRTPEAVSQAEAFSLTSRENEILQLLGKGLTGIAIGHLLGISPRTVAKHVEHAYAKLGCTNRIDALRRLRGEDPSGSDPNIAPVDTRARPPSERP
ncbi:response regulator transcription factor [Pseudarthrobacter sulfonivorans]|uniref:response regulator transcription factor n=1 Tax=Pseudarthrobacter sulfonivorans TaxID=121292 RepID=UPI0021063B5A|nr:helix-turn-helix transcriptional regulator [Pseudarthrobacter sulfonivorans]